MHMSNFGFIDRIKKDDSVRYYISHSLTIQSTTINVVNETMPTQLGNAGFFTMIAEFRGVYFDIIHNFTPGNASVVAKKKANSKLITGLANKG